GMLDRDLAAVVSRQDCQQRLALGAGRDVVRIGLVALHFAHRTRAHRAEQRKAVDALETVLPVDLELLVFLEVQAGWSGLEVHDTKNGVGLSGLLEFRCKSTYLSRRPTRIVGCSTRCRPSPQSFAPRRHIPPRQTQRTQAGLKRTRPLRVGW